MQGDLRAYHDLLVDYWSNRLLLFAKLLPSDPRQGSVFLQVCFSTKDCALELDSGYLAELLPERTLWSELEL